jgi:hypothetical protein
MIAQRHGRGLLGQAEQGVNLCNAEALGQGAADFWCIDFSQGIDGQGASILKEEKESAQGRQSAGIGPCADLASMAILEKLLHLFLADLFRNRWCGAGQKMKKRVQIRAIGGDSVFGEPSLDGQVLQEKLQMFDVFCGLQGRRRKEGKNKRPNGEPLGRAG